MFEKFWLLPFVGTSVLLYVCICCIHLSSAWRPFQIKLTNLSLQSTHNDVSLNITMKDSVIDSWIEVRETIQQLYVHTEVRLDLGNGKFEFEFMNRTVNLCRLYRDKKYEPLIQIVQKNILRHCDCMIRCPIQKKLFHLKELRISSEDFPPIFPERKAFVETKFLGKIHKSLELLARLSVVCNIEKSFKSTS